MGRGIMANLMPISSEKEIEYLRSQHLARVATSSQDRIPDVAPVGFDFDGNYFYIGAMNITKTTKYNNIVRNKNVALVIDDLTTINPWDPRGIKTYGSADIVTREELAGSRLRDNNHFKAVFIRIKPSKKSGAGELTNLCFKRASSISKEHQCNQ